MPIYTPAGTNITGQTGAFRLFLDEEERQRKEKEQAQRLAAESRAEAAIKATPGLENLSESRYKQLVETEVAAEKAAASGLKPTTELSAQPIQDFAQAGERKIELRPGVVTTNWPSRVLGTEEKAYQEQALLESKTGRSRPRSLEAGIPSTESEVVQTPVQANLPTFKEALKIVTPYTTNIELDKTVEGLIDKVKDPAGVLKQKYDYMEETGTPRERAIAREKKKELGLTGHPAARFGEELAAQRVQVGSETSSMQAKIYGEIKSHLKSELQQARDEQFHQQALQRRVQGEELALSRASAEARRAGAEATITEAEAETIKNAQAAEATFLKPEATPEEIAQRSGKEISAGITSLTPQHAEAIKDLRLAEGVYEPYRVLAPRSVEAIAAGGEGVYPFTSEYVEPRLKDIQTLQKQGQKLPEIFETLKADIEKNGEFSPEEAQKELTGLAVAFKQAATENFKRIQPIEAGKIQKQREASMTNLGAGATEGVAMVNVDNVYSSLAQNAAQFLGTKGAQAMAENPALKKYAPATASLMGKIGNGERITDEEFNAAWIAFLNAQTKTSEQYKAVADYANILESGDYAREPLALKAAKQRFSQMITGGFQAEKEKIYKQKEQIAAETTRTMGMEILVNPDAVVFLKGPISGRKDDFAVVNLTNRSSSDVMNFYNHLSPAAQKNWYREHISVANRIGNNYVISDEHELQEKRNLFSAGENDLKTNIALAGGVATDIGGRATVAIEFDKNGNIDPGNWRAYYSLLHDENFEGDKRGLFNVLARSRMAFFESDGGSPNLDIDTELSLPFTPAIYASSKVAPTNTFEMQSIDNATIAPALEYFKAVGEQVTTKKASPNYTREISQLTPEVVKALPYLMQRILTGGMDEPFKNDETGRALTDLIVRDTGTKEAKDALNTLDTYRNNILSNGTIRLANALIKSGDKLNMVKGYRLLRIRELENLRENHKRASAEYAIKTFQDSQPFLNQRHPVIPIPDNMRGTTDLVDFAKKTIAEVERLGNNAHGSNADNIRITLRNLIMANKAASRLEEYETNAWNLGVDLKPLEHMEADQAFDILNKYVPPSIIRIPIVMTPPATPSELKKSKEVLLSMEKTIKKPSELAGKVIEKAKKLETERKRIESEGIRLAAMSPEEKTTYYGKLQQEKEKTRIAKEEQRKKEEEQRKAKEEQRQRARSMAKG